MLGCNVLTQVGSMTGISSIAELTITVKDDTPIKRIWWKKTVGVCSTGSLPFQRQAKAGVNGDTAQANRDTASYKNTRVREMKKGETARTSYHRQSQNSQPSMERKMIPTHGIARIDDPESWRDTPPVSASGQGQRPVRGRTRVQWQIYICGKWTRSGNYNERWKTEQESNAQWQRLLTKKPKSRDFE